MHTVYTGERVRIRPFRDAGEYKLLTAHETARINDHWGASHCPSRSLEQSFLSAGLLGYGKGSLFAVERLDTGVIVGNEGHGLIPPGQLFTGIGTYIMEEHQHNGFGIEAKLLMMCYLFEHYPVRSVFANTAATHTRARAGIEACGFELRGLRRCAHYRRGSYVDLVEYQLMRPDWEKLPIRQIVKRG